MNMKLSDIIKAKDRIDEINNVIEILKNVREEENKQYRKSLYQYHAQRLVENPNKDHRGCGYIYSIDAVTAISMAVDDYNKTVHNIEFLDIS